MVVRQAAVLVFDVFHVNDLKVFKRVDSHKF